MPHMCKVKALGGGAHGLQTPSQRFREASLLDGAVEILPAGLAVHAKSEEVILGSAMNGGLMPDVASCVPSDIFHRSVGRTGAVGLPA